MNEISPRDELLELVADLIGTLEWESQRGALVLPSEPVRAAVAEPPRVEPTRVAPARVENVSTVGNTRAVPAPPGPATSTRAPLPAQWAQWTAKRGAALDDLQVAIRACRACARCDARKQVVVGEGQATSGLMVVATEPGEVEERANGPLRGAPGEMLDRMLENVLKLRRAQCYVTTVLHCRPPKGESSAQRAESMRACMANLEREIAVVRPRVIMALGALPTSVLVQGIAYEAALGKWHEAFGAAVLPTFDLAHLVARPADKRLAMAHLLAVSERLAPAS